MATKLLLCVSSEQATIGRWRRRQLSACRRFSNDVEGQFAFANYLRAARGLPVHIVVDTVDEDYRLETLPHARGSDRREMVARKLRQAYRGTPYFSASLQNREAGKRRDDRYLFAAITNSDLLKPWLGAIESNGLSVAGIYPLPMVTVSLIEKLRLKNANLLIVTKNSAGFRQTFFKNLKFRISRLTPSRDSADMADQYYADEVSNTRMYLDALTVTHVDDTLTVVVIDQDDSLAGLPAAIARGRPNIQCQALSRADVIARFGINASDLDVSADALHLQLLGEQSPALNLAPKLVMGGFRRYQARRLVYGFSVATVLAAMVWAGMNVYESMRIESDILDLQRQAQTYQARYQQVAAQFPQAPVSAAILRDTVELAKEIRGAMRTPESMFQVVSQALDASPQIELRRLDWHYGKTLDDITPSGSGRNLAATAATPVQIGIVHAEIHPAPTDYRVLLETINAFAAKLAGNARIAEVRALQLPINTDSSAGLSGSTAVDQEASTQFRLAVVFRPGA
jgi:hypothetical protein